MSKLRLIEKLLCKEGFIILRIYRTRVKQRDTGVNTFTTYQSIKQFPYKIIFRFKELGLQLVSNFGVTSIPLN